MAYRYLSILSRKLVLALVISCSLGSCAYRFTNVVMTVPEGVQSIAVEGIYDTSREVIPHEILWTSLMEEFARNGRLVLTSKEEADALMTVQIKDAQVFPSGAPSSEAITKDPIVSDTDKGNPFAFKNLRRAGNWTTTETVTYTIEVEVHNLRTRETIFSRNYSTSGSFRSIRASSVAQTRSGYLLYEEALQARMKSMSEGIARKVVTDFLL
ncbi:LPS assembly lipoprotein LptE [Pseudobacteriovorax antillogorgiicola]|uniref:Lipopolysaccharide-assembly n=1 Tax=Pseudobacteriovorax antillogorgiicola TaxID=1513793 RepID=A0A1Y6CBP9_9BACT|nr:LPS assembly lipoprotein LptE [Pseudobacteriovorax antillogorgiicola]TCS48617.1 lipopolysaccharide assembly protein [Pseudobacteriovorax antillogorgiicola]SMF55461.1 Lipopolysaccharide-assembly [Pseudobacteriovorax antillogorgiicola]